MMFLHFFLLWKLKDGDAKNQHHFLQKGFKFTFILSLQ